MFIDEVERLEEGIRDVLDVLSGFSRPMSDKERIRLSMEILNNLLDGK